MAYPNLQAVNNPPFTNLASEIPDIMTEEQVFAIGATELFEVDAEGNPTVIPLGQSGPFVLAVDSEAILCSSFSNGRCLVYVDSTSDGRGYIETDISQHIPGSGNNVSLVATSVQSVATGGGGGSGTVDSVNSGTDITVDNTDPANPVVNFSGSIPEGSSTVTGPDSFGAPAVVGTAGTFAREDHDHGLPSAPSGTYVGPLWLDQVDWIFLNLTIAGGNIPTYVYDNGTAGVGATVTQLSPSAVLTIDGGTPSIGDRVAFCDFTAGSHTGTGNNYSAGGIYTVTVLGDGVSVPWVLTRAADNDTNASLFAYWSVTVALTGAGAQFGPGSKVVVAYTAGGLVGTTDVYLNVMDTVSFAGGGGFAVAIDGAFAFGDGAIAVQDNSVALGAGAKSTNGGAAIGDNATSSATFATAIGEGASATVAGEVNIPGSQVTRKFPFAYDTANLLTGATLYTPTVGDILLDAWIEIDTAWDGVTPTGDFGTFTGIYGVLNDIGGPVWNMLHGGTDFHGNAGLFWTQNASLVACAATADGNHINGQVTITAANPVKVVVSQDGTTDTIPSSFNSSTPPPVLPLVVTTGVNDQFNFTLNRGTPAPDLFTVAQNLTGYTATADVATALNAAIDGSSNVFSATWGTWTDDGSGNLQLTLLAAGGNGSTVTAGTNDIVAGLGLSVSTTTGGTGGDPGSTVGSAILYLVTSTPV